MNTPPVNKGPFVRKPLFIRKQQVFIVYEEDLVRNSKTVLLIRSSKRLARRRCDLEKAHTRRSKRLTRRRCDLEKVHTRRSKRLTMRRCDFAKVHTRRSL